MYVTNYQYEGVERSIVFRKGHYPETSTNLVTSGEITTDERWSADHNNVDISKWKPLSLHNLENNCSYYCVEKLHGGFQIKQCIYTPGLNEKFENSPVLATLFWEIASSVDNQFAYKKWLMDG